MMETLTLFIYRLLLSIRIIESCKSRRDGGDDSEQVHPDFRIDLREKGNDDNNDVGEESLALTVKRGREAKKEHKHR